MINFRDKVLSKNTLVDEMSFLHFVLCYEKNVSDRLQALNYEEKLDEQTLHTLV